MRKTPSSIVRSWAVAGIACLGLLVEGVPTPAADLY